MARMYLLFTLYLLSLQATVRAVDYEKKDTPDMNSEDSISPVVTGTGPLPEMDFTKLAENQTAPSVEPTTPTLTTSDSQKPLSGSGELSSFYTGTYNPYATLYPEPSSPYPGSFGPYLDYYGSSASFPIQPIPTGSYPENSIAYFGTSGAYPSPTAGYLSLTSLNANLPSTSSAPVSMDYISRYQGPGSVLMVLPDGKLADTPEVIATRAAHLTALQRAQALWHSPKDDNAYSFLKNGGLSSLAYPTTEPVGLSVYGPTGSSVSGPTGPFVSGPTGPSVSGPTGPFVSGPTSPSVSGSTGSSVSGHAGLLGLGGGYSHPIATGCHGLLGNGQQGSVASQFQGPLTSGTTESLGQNYQSSGYQGPLSSPTVLPSGYLADTPEVVAAKMAHLRAVVKALENASSWRISTHRR